MALNSEINKEQRWVVRILLGEKPQAKQVYFRNNMVYIFFEKWQWYFEYRAALLKVQNPKIKVHYEYGAYDYILPEIEYKYRLSNIIKKRKGQISQYKNKIKYAKSNWNELFPIEQKPEWVKITDKLNKLESEYQIAISKMDDLIKNGYKQETQPLICLNQLVSTGL